MEAQLRMGIIGGGPGSFIGDVHIKAASFDNLAELVCGAFSTSQAKSLQSGELYRLNPERVYASYAEMFQKEAALPPEKRPHFFIIATPNHLHYEPAMLAMKAGFHVACDKPVAISSIQAKEIARTAAETNRAFLLTHHAAGYPAVMEARAMLASHQLGKIRKILVEYPQGWLSQPVEKAGNKQAKWRLDPGQSGMAGCIADIGSHAFNLLEFMTGLQVQSVCADLTSFVPGRTLDDDGSILLRLSKDAKGMMNASQILVGEGNDLNIRIYGETGAIEWHQEIPGQLILRYPDKPTQILNMGVNTANHTITGHKYARLPTGHPEGLYEAFASVYRSFMGNIRKIEIGENPAKPDYPSVYEGIREMLFIEAAVRSSEKGTGWTYLE